MKMLVAASHLFSEAEIQGGGGVPNYFVSRTPKHKGDNRETLCKEIT